MHIGELGEDSFIEYLVEQFQKDGPIMGIGDDCAVIPTEQGMAWVVTTDALVEGVHFLKEEISAHDLGYKTVAVNVSDIAAMGGIPHYAFLSIALPKTVECKWIYDFTRGIKEALLKWNLSLLGGDTVGSKRDLFINLTLIGAMPESHVKYRSQAKVGDLICVTGFLGNSGGGLVALQKKLVRTKEVKHLIHAHFRPEPSVETGAWLAKQTGVHAMMDLSDGLDLDLKRLLKSSHSGAFIEISRLPLSESLLKVSLENGWDPLKLALSGGEDYCLLLTVSPDAFPSIREAFQKQFGSPLYEIGQIREEGLVYYNQGEKVEINMSNFNHWSLYG